MIKITMTLTIPSLLLGSLLLVSSVYADGNASKGQSIYSASECMRCHQTNEMFTRTNRKVKTLPQLNAQVRRCDAQLSTNLFDDEIEDVVAYLNQRYYKFPNGKQNTVKESKKTFSPMDKVVEK